MGSKGFSSLEIDAIGEILNISLGASATAVSTMLSARVDITTPIVKVVSSDEFGFSNLEPAIGVEITYISGLSGNNIMLLKRQDVKVIVEMLMGMEIADEDFTLDEMNISAICEVMNQMMGASSTALSEFLGKVVNISTPVSFEIRNEEEFKQKYFGEEDPMVVVGFTLNIENKLKSEFINVMPPELAKTLVSAFLPEGMDLGDEEEPEEAPSTPDTSSMPSIGGGGGGVLSQAEIERLLNQAEDISISAPPVEQPTPQPQAMQQPNPYVQPQMAQQPVPVQQPVMMPQMSMPTSTGTDPLVQQMMQQQMAMMQQMQQMMQNVQQPQPKQPAQPKTINVKPMAHQKLTSVDELGEEQAENLELIMGVPLEISVEIGRTRRLVKDILELTNGSLVILDKLAGEQVDLFVNGQCIAKGDVVVIDDNFGIRITEIITKEVVE